MLVMIRVSRRLQPRVGLWSPPRHKAPDGPIMFGCTTTRRYRDVFGGRSSFRAQPVCVSARGADAAGFEDGRFRAGVVRAFVEESAVWLRALSEQTQRHHRERRIRAFQRSARSAVVPATARRRTARIVEDSRALDRAAVPRPRGGSLRPSAAQAHRSYEPPGGREASGFPTSFGTWRARGALRSRLDVRLEQTSASLAGSPWMARGGLEPPTPRFSVACSTS